MTEKSKGHIPPNPYKTLKPIILDRYAATLGLTKKSERMEPYEYSRGEGMMDISTPYIGRDIFTTTSGAKHITSKTRMMIGLTDYENYKKSEGVLSIKTGYVSPEGHRR